jgi:hypothetical protein
VAARCSLGEQISRTGSKFHVEKTDSKLALKTYYPHFNGSLALLRNTVLFFLSSHLLPLRKQMTGLFPQ